jgi:predicted O-methyltransferase YrrM
MGSSCTKNFIEAFKMTTRLYDLILLFRAKYFNVKLEGLPIPYCHLEKVYPYDPFGWFSKPKEKVMKRLINETKAKVVVELGSFLGKSTRFIAHHLPSNGKVFAVDHWRGNIEHQNPERKDVFHKLDTLYEQFLSNIIHARLYNKVIPVKETSLDAINKIQTVPDLVFVDASHEYEDVLRDLVAWYPKLRPGGVLIGDDWNWGEGKPVRKAVIDFATENRVPYFTEAGMWWIFSSIGSIS